VVVGIPLAIHSLQRLDQANSTVAAAKDVSTWAPDLILERVRIDRSAQPILVTVGVTGRAAPPDRQGGRD
jgi:hypothetical protein